MEIGDFNVPFATLTEPADVHRPDALRPDIGFAQQTGVFDPAAQARQTPVVSEADIPTIVFTGTAAHEPQPPAVSPALPARRPMSTVGAGGEMLADPRSTDARAAREKEVAQRVLDLIHMTDNTGMLRQIAEGAVPEVIAQNPALAQWMVDRARQQAIVRGGMPLHEAVVVEQADMTPAGGYRFAYNQHIETGKTEPLLTSAHAVQVPGYQGEHRAEDAISPRFGHHHARA